MHHSGPRSAQAALVHSSETQIHTESVKLLLYFIKIQAKHISFSKCCTKEYLILSVEFSLYWICSLFYSIYFILSLHRSDPTKIRDIKDWLLTDHHKKSCEIWGVREGNDIVLSLPQSVLTCTILYQSTKRIIYPDRPTFLSTLFLWWMDVPIFKKVCVEHKL